jgi:hypothetical protein
MVATAEELELKVKQLEDLANKHPQLRPAAASARRAQQAFVAATDATVKQDVAMQIVG